MTEERDGSPRAQRSAKLTSQHFFLPMREIAITSEPTREQDVIALFNYDVGSDELLRTLAGTPEIEAILVNSRMPSTAQTPGPHRGAGPGAGHGVSTPSPVASAPSTAATTAWSGAEPQGAPGGVPGRTERVA